MVLGRAEQWLGTERTAPSETGVVVWRWSTRDIPPWDRVSSWHDVHARAIARRTISVFSENFGNVDVQLTRLGAPGHQVGLQHMQLIDASVATRERALLSDGSDDVILHLQISGARELEQSGRTATALPGGAVFSLNAEPSIIRLPAGADFVSIALPHAAIYARTKRIEDAAAIALPPDHPSVNLLAAYLTAIGRCTDADIALGQLMAGHMLDLAAHLADSALGYDGAERRRLGAVRLTALKADIDANLGGDVSAPALAERHGVSDRYIHKLFAAEGTTVSHYVQGLRLERVRRWLGDPRYWTRTIAELVFDAGFGDISTFNRAFRQHFGETPSETRQRAKSVHDWT